jgi:hypothetical protein
MDHEKEEGSLEVVRSLHSHETREEGERHHDYLIRRLLLTLEEEDRHRSDIHAEAYDVVGAAMVHWDDKDTVREEEVHRRHHHWQIRSR